MPVKQRVARWAICGAVCAAGITPSLAQESFIRQHPVETVVVPLPRNTPPQSGGNNGGNTDNVPVQAPNDDGLGLRLGSFVLTRGFDAGIDYTDNVFATNSNKTGDRIYSVSPSLGLRSDWSRHSLSLNATAARGFYEKNPSEDTISANATGRLRIDIRRGTTLDLRSGFTLDQEQRGTDDLNVNATKPSNIYGLTASAALNHRINRVTMSLRGGIEKLRYQDTKLTGGAVEDNSDRDYTQTNTTLRVGYDISPRLIVFSDINYAKTVYKRRVDNNGDIRDSHSYGASAGAAFSISDLLNGEISVGYRKALFDDPTFANIDALVANASLSWRPSRLTEITANFTTDLGQTTLSGTPGSVIRTASVNLNHAWRENIDLIASGAVEHEDFKGVSLTEVTYTASFGIDYDLGRKMTLGARYNYEKFDSSAAGADYTINTVGVRLTYAD